MAVGKITSLLSGSHCSQSGAKHAALHSFGSQELRREDSFDVWAALCLHTFIHVLHCIDHICDTAK